MTDVVVRDVTMRYGEQVVLSHFSHRFSTGRAHCVMGPSGCGKTTLLRLIAGLETPESGEIEGVGKLGFLFQEDRLIPGLSAVSNVTMAAGCSREAAAALLTELGVETDSQTKPTALLSGGQARRTALARALLAPGDLLILDEPFNGLDEGSRQRCAAAIRDYRQGRTLVTVTHNLEDLPLLGIEKRITL